jgi:hypothetical protein
VVGLRLGFLKLKGGLFRGLMVADSSELETPGSSPFFSPLLLRFYRPNRKGITRNPH